MARPLRCGGLPPLRRSPPLSGPYRCLAHADGGGGRLSPPLIEAHCSQRLDHARAARAREAKKRDAKVKELAALGLRSSRRKSRAMRARGRPLSCATLSRSRDPRAWLKSGAHLDLVGAFTPEMRESDDGAVGRASLFCDTRAGAMKEGGDLVIPLKAGLITESAIKADLADLTRGRHRGRSTEDEATLFKSVGTAIEDFAAARLAMQRLKERYAYAASPTTS